MDSMYKNSSSRLHLSFLELCKCRERHGRAEAHLEWAVLGHGRAQIHVLHILLQSVKRKDIVTLGCSVLFELVSIGWK